MRFTFYGHACFGIEIGEHTLLVDPFIRPNEQAADVDVDAIEASHILVTHGHFDHVADAVEIAKRTGAQVVGNFEVIAWFETQGIENVHPMNHGGTWSFPFGTVRYTHAVHSSVLPDGTDGGNPGGFLITTDEGTIYVAGDTALTMDMKLIPHWGRPDVVILPVGDNFTMGVSDAILAADFVQCDRVIGVHFDTFGFIEIDHDEATSEFRRHGKDLTLPSIGQTIEL